MQKDKQMLYNVLLSIDLSKASSEQQMLIDKRLQELHWSKLDELNTTWSTVKIATDTLTTKFKIELDLRACLNEINDAEIHFAFQMSLGEITHGMLKQQS